MTDMGAHAAEHAGEFEWIRRHFKRPARRSPLGVGDDCALLAPAAGMQLAVSTDMLVEGRHFLPTVPARRLGHKALAVNLSDLAACGARPLAFTLALSLPRADEIFLREFAAGLFELADAHQIELVGGDTTAGPLNICITVFGEVAAGQALLRSGAMPGDDLWVSGTLGDARLALEAFRGTVQLDGSTFEKARHAMEMPSPRVALGLALRGVARSAIDLSDGLVGDLGHVLEQSGVRAEILLQDLPRSQWMRQQAQEVQQQCLLAGGDDYELLFSAAPALREQVQQAASATQVPVSRIGRVLPKTPGTALVVLDVGGRPLDLARFQGFDHFRA